MVPLAQLHFHERDEFKREQVANNLIRLLDSGIDISPLVIDGDWGTGKTEFCHKLINKLKTTEQPAQILYVDAFQADHAANPLMTILAAVISLLPDERAKKTFLQTAIPVARYGLATIGKAAVNHLFKQNADAIADELEKHLQEAADKAIDASVTALLKDHQHAEANLKALQEALTQLANNTPIILFIDELDRCRPDFSVQMLEVIKHTFNVPRITFVLVTNLQQLKAAINHSYGPRVDAQRYLDKFLKFSFRLPEFVIDKSSGDLKQQKVTVQHFTTLVSGSTVLSATALAAISEAGFGFCGMLIANNNLSLREVETFTRHLEIYHTLSQGLDAESNGHLLLRLFGVFLHCFRNDLVESIKNNNTDANQITSPLGDYNWSAEVINLPRNKHLDAIAFMLAQDSANNSIKNKINDEILRDWSQMELNYFDGWGYRGDNKFEVIKEVLNVFDLGRV